MHLAQSKVSLEPFQRLIGSRDEVLVELRRVRNTQDFQKSSSFWYLFLLAKGEKVQLTICSNIPTNRYEYPPRYVLIRKDDR